MLNTLKSITNLLKKKGSKDFSFDSGERQTGKTLNQIRIDHILRYRFAQNFIENLSDEVQTCLDAFCGNGYGTYLLANEFPFVKFTGIDGSMGAIECANENYLLSNNEYSAKIFPFNLNKKYDIVISFESLEHVSNDTAMLKLINQCLNLKGKLLLSVPNENLQSLKLNPHPFHFKHYTHKEIIDLTCQNFELLNWYGQNIYEFNRDGKNTYQLLSDSKMNLKEKEEGQVNIYVLEKRG